MDHRRHPGAAVMTDADVARTAALAGAAIAHDLFGATHTHFDKGAGDFATEADVAAERAIIDTIRTARPDDAITGEESGHTGPATSDRTWLVDPLCGTLNYAAGTRLVAVNVALRTGTDIAVAAVADPFTDEVFWTDGTTATVSRNDTKEPLKPSAHPPLVDLNLDPPFPNAPAFRATTLLTDPGFTERFRPRVTSTTLTLAWVATGRRAAYVTDGHVHDSVHFAAGIALCRAAGCVVTGLDGNPPERGTGGLIAAADQDTHKALLDLVGIR
ncbi:inositol monophosphatase family protein [Nonomuraea salmonea]|uniref:Inositol monophosphatase family protein n=1 Tax=Nonomuraea salmonea TaxID=46181 RepID=A0ABV5NGZ2_9ACTN